MTEDAWACCDACGKWRRVRQEVAARLNDDSPWYCKDNDDPVYNNCNVPQELTDTEIDERTALPVQEDNGPADTVGDDGLPSPREVALRAGKLRKRPPVWQLITKNNYTHRERKRQDEDEIMICQCKPIWGTDSTTIGCGDSCLNRMLNIECVPKYCPCGERCSNQAFSKRQYAKLEVRRAGAKGFGLFTAEDLSAGQFIVEYVGEVLEEEEYARRKEFYIATGQRHYYFMNIGNGEVIDAARRGGLGRFINHSCEPNCETQKWVVRGELAIGLFTLEDIPAGTELTFDYNFERYGDKPMKCLCGSKACRGVIGGSQELASRIADSVVVPDEQDELEPIMITEKEADEAIVAILDREVGLGWEHGWDSRLQKRLERLAAQRGISIPAGDRPAPGLSGDEQESEADDDEEIAAAAAAAVKVAAAITAGRRDKGSARKSRMAKPRDVDPDWKDTTARENSAAQEREDPGTSGRQGTTGTTLIPKRAPSMPNIAGRMAASFLRRRSEVDRRLEGFVGPSGRLRDVSAPNVVRMLRLFNLCDIGPTVSRPALGEAPSPVHPDPDPAVPTTAPVENGKAVHDVNGTAQAVTKEEGEIMSPKLRPTADGNSPQAKGGVDSDDGTSRTLSRAIDGAAPHQLTSRQRARMADMSLLLDVILKSSHLSARKAFVECGLLRQLLGCVGRNIGEPYTVVLRKVLRVVDALPFSADNVHQTRSAHGSFVDLLRALTAHPDYEVRNAAWALLRKWPLNASQRPGTVESWHSSAGSARTPMNNPGGPPIPLGSCRDSASRERALFIPDGDNPNRPSSMSPYASGFSSFSHSGRRPPHLKGEPVGPSRFGGKGPPPLAPVDYSTREDSRKRSRWEPLSLAGRSSPGRAFQRLPEEPLFTYGPGGPHARPASGSGSYLSETASLRERQGLVDYELSRGRSEQGGPPEAVNGPELGPPPFSRPHSASFSDLSHGSRGEEAPPPARPPPPPPPPLPEGPVLSPMTDDDEGGVEEEEKESESGPESLDADGYFPIHVEVPVVGPRNTKVPSQPRAPLVATGSRKLDISFEKPNAAFEEFVAEVVRHRVGKYEQPDHPMRLTRDEAVQIYRRIRREIMEKEQEAYRERQRSGMSKPIEASKVEGRIKDFVRDRMRKFYAQRTSFQ